MKNIPRAEQRDAIAAGHRRLPMVKIDGTPFIGEGGAVTLPDVLKDIGHPAPEQCEGVARLDRVRAAGDVGGGTDRLATKV
jgi:hypothetical protein